MNAQNVPIIDREIFFGDPEVSAGQLSPDGKWLTFIKPYQDVRNIWIKSVDEDFDKARPLTADTLRPIPGYFWSRDSRYILYVQDKGGDENYHVYAVDPFSKVKGPGNVPPARNITDFDGVRAIIQNVPRTNPKIMYVGMNDRDASWHDLYEVNIQSGERKLIYENVDRISGFDFDHKDEIRLASRVKNDGSTELLKYEDGKFSPFYDCSFEETCYVYDFHKDNNQVYMVTNKGDRNLTELVLYDLSSGKETFIEKDPKNEADFGGLYLSKITKEPIATIYTGDKTDIYFKNSAYEKDYKWLETQLPGAEINLGSSTDDERRYLVYANSDTDPGAAYLFDRDNQKLIFQYRPRPELPTEHLCTMEAIRYKSTDGLEIPAYLTIPKGAEAKGLPAIMLIHGGPWARDYWGYDSYAQFLANRGYVVLQPNFRSSTGFGKDFLNAGNGEWGDLMQDDISAGVKYLIDNGIANPDKVAIMGGSYGGYATLAGVTFTPDLYAAGVSIVGPSNLITLLGSIPPYWEAGRVIMYKRMANPDTPEGKAKLERQSPLNSVNNIKCPLMIVQGANDPRVKQAESDQIVVAMREAKLPVKYLIADDEGHGFRKPVNQMAFIAETEKFLAEHLGGRYQKDMDEEVAKRLKEIDKDINTVELTKALSEEELSTPLPVLNGSVSPRHLRYSLKIEMGGQSMALVVKKLTEIKNNQVAIRTMVESPMMNLREDLTLNQENLTPISKTISQGPVNMEFEFGDSKVDGKVDMNGDIKEMSLDLPNDVWDDNSGLEWALCLMDLKEGKEEMTRVYDAQNNKVKNLKISVGAIERIETSAGKFKCYKVVVDDVEDSNPQTFYISSDAKDRKLIKKESIIKEMGGAKASMELAGEE